MFLHQRGHLRLPGRALRQLVAFLLDVAFGRFLAEQLGEVGRVDAHQFTQLLFQQKAQCGGADLRQQRGAGFDQFGFALVGV